MRRRGEVMTASLLLVLCLVISASSSWRASASEHDERNAQAPHGEAGEAAEVEVRTALKVEHEAQFYAEDGPLEAAAASIVPEVRDPAESNCVQHAAAHLDQRDAHLQREQLTVREGDHTAETAAEMKSGAETAVETASEEDKYDQMSEAELVAEWERMRSAEAKRLEEGALSAKLGVSPSVNSLSAALSAFAAHPFSASCALLRGVCTWLHTVFTILFPDPLGSLAHNTPWHTPKLPSAGRRWFLFVCLCCLCGVSDRKLFLDLKSVCVWCIICVFSRPCLVLSMRMEYVQYMSFGYRRVCC
jgi:hypothetical protein